MAKTFDPADQTVDEVLAHLESADEDERNRVFDAERAGKARVGILEKAPFDPSEHTVDEVVYYLENAEEPERTRVLQAERDGKARVGVLGSDNPDQHPFVAGAASFVEDVAGFVNDTRDELAALLDEHAEVTASSAGELSHRDVAYQLDRVGSTLPDLGRALDQVAATAASLAAAAATVEG